WLPTIKEGYSKTRSSFALTRRLANPTTSTEVGVVLIELKTDAISEQLAGLSGGGNHIYMIDDEQNMTYADVASNISLPFNVKLPEDERIHFYESAGQDGEDALIAYNKSSVTNWNLVGTYPIDTLVEGTDEI